MDAPDSSWGGQHTTVHALRLHILGTRVLPGIVVCDALLALLGRFADIPVLYRYGPAGLPSTDVNVAFCLFLLAVAQMLPNRQLVDRIIGCVAGTVVGGIAAVTPIADLLYDHRHGDPPPHRLALGDLGALLTERMAPQASVTLLILAVITVRARRRHLRWEFIQAGGLTVAVSGSAALVGLGFGASRIWTPSTFGVVAAPSAVGVICLGLSLFVSAPDRIPANLLVAPGSGGRMARTLLPVTLLQPVITAGLLRMARSSGLAGEAEAWSVMVIAGVAVPAVAILIVGNALERIETQRAGAEAHAERARARLGLLADVGALVADATTAPDLHHGVSRVLARHFDAWCGIYQPDDDRTLVLRGSATADTALHLPANPPAHPPSIADLRAGELRWDGASSSVPLVARGETIGVITLTHPDLRRSPALTGGPDLRRRPGIRPRRDLHHDAAVTFDGDDERALVDVGRRVGAALDNLRLLAARTRAAALLQESLLPQRLPEVPRAEIAVRYLSGDVNADVGGDFYDAFPLGHDEYAFVIGDVSGRGLEAAGLTGLARTTLRTLDAGVGPAAALRRLNDLLLDHTDGSRFLTAAYLRVGPRGDTGATATLCLAGHPPPVLVGAGGTTTMLGSLGTLLGVYRTPTLVEQAVALRPGDTVVLYTDGVTEAKGADGLFGERRLSDALASLAGRPAETVVADLERRIARHQVGASDDVAVLALRLVPSGESVQQTLVDLHLPVDAAAVVAARRSIDRVGGQLSVPGALHDHLVATVGRMMSTVVDHIDERGIRTLRSDPIRLRVLRRSGLLRVEILHPGRDCPLADLPVAAAGCQAHAAAPSDGGPGADHRGRCGVDADGGASRVWFEVDLPDPPVRA